MANKMIINKHGYEVESPSRCRSAVKGQTIKVGDTVESIFNSEGTVKAKIGDRFKVKCMWKNKYQTVLEFEGTTFSAASILFRKVQ